MLASGADTGSVLIAVGLVPEVWPVPPLDKNTAEFTWWANIFFSALMAGQESQTARIRYRQINPLYRM